MLQRDKTVSIAKGIAIILMVLAHTRFWFYGAWYINMFHMPLFFLLSGYCFKDKYLDDFKDFFVKRIKGIYFPYVKWCLVFLLLHFFFVKFYLIDEAQYNSSQYFSKLIGIFTLNGGASQLLGGYWFLETLFWICFISYFWLKVSRNPLLGVVVMGGISIILLWRGWSVPHLCIGGKEFLASSFYLMGKFLKERSFYFRCNWIVLLFSVALIAVGTLYWEMGMNGNRMCWWKVLPYFVTAMLGINLVISLSKYLDGRWGSKPYVKFLVDAGDNSLTILTWHFLSFKIVSLLIIVIGGLSIDELSEFPVITRYAQMGFSLLYFVVGIVVPMVIAKYNIFKILR